jgi:hypothetical protein
MLPTRTNILYNFSLYNTCPLALTFSFFPSFFLNSFLLTYLLTYILNYIFTYSLTYLHTHLLAYLLTYLHTYLLIYVLTPWFFGRLKALAFLTLSLLTSTIVAPLSNDSKWQMGFISSFKVLTREALSSTSFCHQLLTFSSHGFFSKNSTLLNLGLPNLSFTSGFFSNNFLNYPFMIHSS